MNTAGGHIEMQNDKPDWWLERPHKLDLTPNEDKPTFMEGDLFREYLKREYDDIMGFEQYKIARMDVINILDNV